MTFGFMASRTCISTSKRERRRPKPHRFIETEYEVHVLDSLSDAPFTMLSMAETTTTLFISVSLSMKRSQKLVPRAELSEGTLNSRGNRMTG